MLPSLSSFSPESPVSAPTSQAAPLPGAPSAAAVAEANMASLCGHTVFYGGSFDPAHVGHVQAGVALLRAGAHELWLVPTYTHADKENQCPYPLRLEQCRAVAGEIDRCLPEPQRGRVRVSEVESRIHSQGQTVRVMQYLHAAHPERRFALAMGSDCWAKAHLWEGWDRLQQLARVVVLSRPGYPAAQGDFATVPMPDVSSTSIRERLQMGQPVDALVPPKVISIIHGAALYGVDARAQGVAQALQPPDAQPAGGEAQVMPVAPW